MSAHEFNNPPTSENWFRIKEDLEHIDAVVDEDKPRDVPKPGGGSRPNITKIVERLDSEFRGLISTKAIGRVAEQADATATALSKTEKARDEAFAARDAAYQSGNMYPDTDSALNALSEGDYFNVPAPGLIVGYRPYRVVNGAAVAQPVDKTLQQNGSSDTAQLADSAGVAVLRVAENGGVHFPGRNGPFQNNYASSAAADLEAYRYWGGDDDAVIRKLSDRIANEAALPINVDFEITAHDADNTKLQRIAAAIEHRPGELLVVHQQTAPDGTADSLGVRLVQRFVSYRIDNDGVGPTLIGDIDVIEEPDDFRDENPRGNSHHPHMFKRKSDNATVMLFNRVVEFDDDRGRRQILVQAEMPESSNSFSNFRILFGSSNQDAEEHVLPGNGCAIRLQNGPSAGRIVIPVYIPNQALISDDDGQTWRLFESFSASMSEWAIAELPSGEIVGSGRPGGGISGPAPQVFSLDGGETWQNRPLDKTQWSDSQNNRSLIQPAHAAVDGFPKLIWCGTVPIDDQGGTFGRKGLALRLSYDYRHVSSLYRFFEPSRPAGYSSIIALSRDLFFVTYETGFNGPPVSMRGRFINMAEIINGAAY